MFATSVGKSAPSMSVTDCASSISLHKLSKQRNGSVRWRLPEGLSCRLTGCQLMKSTVERTWMLNPGSEFCFKIYYLKKI